MPDDLFVSLMKMSPLCLMICLFDEGESLMPDDLFVSLIKLSL